MFRPLCCATTFPMHSCYPRSLFVFVFCLYVSRRYMSLYRQKASSVCFNELRFVWDAPVAWADCAWNSLHTRLVVLKCLVLCLAISVFELADWMLWRKTCVSGRRLLKLLMSLNEPWTNAGISCFLIAITYSAYTCILLLFFNLFFRIENRRTQHK